MMLHYRDRQLLSHATIFRAGEAPSESQNVPRSEKLKTSIMGIAHSDLREFKEELDEGTWQKRRATYPINYYEPSEVYKRNVKGTINSQDTFEYHTKPLSSDERLVMVRGIKGDSRGSASGGSFVAYKADVEKFSNKE